MRISAYLLLLAGNVAAFVCQAGEGPQGANPSGLVQQVIEARESWKLKTEGNVQLVIGNNLWQPGEQYTSGDGWLALACDGAACTLVPAELDVIDESWQGHYDDEPTAGQQLIFRLTIAEPGKPVAWLRSELPQSWLKPGPVPSYYAGDRYRRLPDKEGTMEVLVETPGGAKATLVPMLASKSFLESLVGKQETIYYGALLLQLRTKNKRQLLPGAFGTCSGEVNPDYLMWAGDLDRDDKPDFLVSYVDADGPVHLYLSGAAKDGQIVGLASIFSSPPFGGECDGGPPSYLD